MERLLYRGLIIERGLVSCGEVTIPGPYNREGVTIPGPYNREGVGIV